MVLQRDADCIITGIPFDGTVSSRPGTRFGPWAIRTATLDIEDYSPYLNRDISDVKLYDSGDIEIPFGDTKAVLNRTKDLYSRYISLNSRLIGLGGEHLISLPMIEVMFERYGKELFVIQFDAHADQREDYLGVKYSHATVMNLVSELIGIENIAMVGVRSGTKEEWKIIQSHPYCFGGASSRPIADFIPFVRDKLFNRKIYITVDLDVFDPGVFPGTGSPEPGGITFNEFIKLLSVIDGLDFIGADLVELAPSYDKSGISSSLAATILRELLLW